MGGLNSLGGLNLVNVDFRPTMEPHVPTKVDAKQDVLPKVGQDKGVDKVSEPEQNDVPEIPQPANAAAKSVVRQLDVLLLNAAGKSVGADIAANVGQVGGSLVSKGVLTQEEVNNLNRLANDAAEKLRALDKFSGRELAQAMKWQTKQIVENDADGNPDTVDMNVFDWDAGSDVGKAVKEAIAYAKTLHAAGQVYEDKDWQDSKKLSQMPRIKAQDEITTSDGQKVVVTCKMGVDPTKKRKNNFVGEYFVNRCPTYYTRDYLNSMFATK